MTSAPTASTVSTHPGRTTQVASGSSTTAGPSDHITAPASVALLTTVRLEPDTVEEGLRVLSLRWAVGMGAGEPTASEQGTEAATRTATSSTEADGSR